VRTLRRGPKLERDSKDAPLVLDLSSLWAGPLCSSLLQAAGARVIKVESLRRPDGARAGPQAFFDLLHAGQRSAALDLASPAGRAALQRLLERADVAIEASRPRALEQLGIDAEQWVCARPGRVWVSISGYGRTPPADGWVAFGDDAAAAAGLAAALARPGEAPRFCGDAIADPLAGLFAAAAVLAARRSGESRLLDVSLCAAAAHALGPPCPADARMRGDPEGWSVEAGGERARVLPPRARPPLGRARALGADTREVLAGC
jgi:crotonobetainyl-CoA:carnitine CoA-transferase CaiB-like acyl-CoA transferase